MPGDDLLLPIILTMLVALGAGVLIVGWQGVATFVAFLGVLWLWDAVSTSSQSNRK